MSSFAALRAGVGYAPIQNIYHATNEANEILKREIRAAQSIQSVARMRRDRNAFTKVVLAVISVQRVYRSFQARREALRKKIALAEERNLRVFHYYATLIQSRIRGYMSRKNNYDFHAQRKYIASVTQTSEQVRQRAQEALEEQLQMLSEKQDETDRRMYLKELDKKHHLLSTATISGVYRPPLTVKGYTTVFGTNIEDDLNVMSKEQRLADTARKFKKDLPSTERHASSLPNRQQQPQNNGNGISLSPSPPRTTGEDDERLSHVVTRGRLWGKSALDTKPTLSLQASTSYDAVESEKKYTSSLSKAVASTMHKGKGFAVRKPDVPKSVVPISIQDPYAAATSSFGNTSKKLL